MRLNLKFDRPFQSESQKRLKTGEQILAAMPSIVPFHRTQLDRIQSILHASQQAAKPIGPARIFQRSETVTESVQTTQAGKIRPGEKQELLNLFEVSNLRNLGALANGLRRNKAIPVSAQYDTSVEPPQGFSQVISRKATIEKAKASVVLLEGTMAGEMKASIYQALPNGNELITIRYRHRNHNYNYEAYMELGTRGEVVKLGWRNYSANIEEQVAVASPAPVVDALPAIA